MSSSCPEPLPFDRGGDGGGAPRAGGGRNQEQGAVWVGADTLSNFSKKRSITNDLSRVHRPVSRHRSRCDAPSDGPCDGPKLPFLLH